MSEVAERRKKHWKDCGYITISKSGRALSVVVKHRRYVANLNELDQVLEGVREYTLIFEPQSEAKSRNEVEG